MQLSVIIPTMQAGTYLPNLLDNLINQDLTPAEIIFIDTASTDDTKEIAAQYGCIIQHIGREDFRHGSTRNIGARLACEEILVFLTQDILPVDNHFLDQLTLPIREGWAQAVTARQVAYPDANPIERLTREFNYPQQSLLRDREDIQRLGIKAVFFSNAASAIQQEVFWSLGGFSEKVIVDEDLELCARLLKTGYRVAYQAEAAIYHSHNFKFSQLFKRYFDIGVFFKQAEETLTGIKVYGEGKRYIVQLTKDLVKQKNFLWIPRLFLESGVKILAYQLGLRYEIIPNQIIRSFSGQPYFWEPHKGGKNG